MKQIFTKFTILFFIACLFAFTFPAIVNINTKLLGDGYDNYQYSGLQSIFRLKIQRLQNPLAHSNEYRFPSGFNLPTSYDGLLPTSLGALIGLIAPHTTSYNLVVFFILATNFFSAYFATFIKTKNKNLALLSGLIFGFSNYLLTRVPNHINLGFAAGLPIFYLGIYSLTKDEDNNAGRYLGIGLLLSTLGSLQYLAFLSIFTFLYFIFTAIFSKNELQNAILNLQKKQHLFPLLLSISSIVFIFYPYISDTLLGKIANGQRQETYIKSKTSFYDLLLPNSYQTFWYTPLIHSNTPRSIEKSTFLGFPEILLFIYFIFQKTENKKRTLALLITYLLLASGFFYQAFFGLPAFSLIPEPGRFILFFTLILSQEAPLIFAKLTPKKQSMVFFILLFLLFISKISINYFSSSNLNDEYLNVVRQKGTGAVLNLPIDYYNPKRNQEATTHLLPITDGYIHWTGNNSKSTIFFQNPTLGRFICDNLDNTKHAIYYDQKKLNYNLIDILNKNKIDIIVLHKDDNLFFSECNMTRSITNQFLPQTNEITSTSNTILSSEHTNTPQLFQRLYFPKKGIFHLNGLLINPYINTPIEIYLNDEAVTNFTFTPVENGQEIYPKDTLAFNIPAGSVMDIYSPELLFKTAYLNLWYSFAEDPSSDIYTDQPIKKIFDNSKASVYKISGNAYSK